MTLIKLDKLSIDPVAFGSQGNAILGIRDSGKSYTATALAEKLFDAGVPFIAFDPIGIWRFLRVPGKGRGYPVVVAGGEEGDLPLTKTGAPEIVRAAMRNGVSLIIDLFDVNLSKADWRKIVLACVQVLLHENKKFGLRHIFIEEAAEFVPQKPLDGEVYAAIEKLARMGGNSRLGYTLINQRSQEVSKAVLELCENVFLHRQRGKNALENLDKWLSIVGAAEQKEIMRTLPDLPQGECWAWLGGDKPQPPMRIKIPAKNSLHPDRRVMHGDKDAKPQGAVDVGKFVEGMRSSLVAVEAEAKANDPKLLRTEIASLKKQLSGNIGQLAAPDPKVIEAAEQRGYANGYTAGKYDGGRSAAHNQMMRVIDGIAGAAMLNGDGEALAEALNRMKEVKIETNEPASAPTYPHFAPQLIAKKEPVRQPTNSHGDLSPALQRVVNAIGWWRKIGCEPVERARASVVAGYSPKASTFGVYIAELVKLGLVESSPGKVALTPAGQALAEVPFGTTREDLREVARGQLSPQEARIFDVVYDAYPDEIHRRAVAESVGLSPEASTVGVYIAGVAAYGMIETASRGHVKAADWLFPNG